jgi:2,4-dienoyl-CoA reductase (NADPH2)
MATPSYPHLFAPFDLRGMRLKNRIVMAPMSTGLGGLAGEVTPEMIAFYRERAQGGQGLIIVEYTSIDPATSRTGPHQLTLEAAENLDGHRRLVRTVQDAGAHIFLQLHHAGQFAKPALVRDSLPVGPSDVPYPGDPSRLRCRALTCDEIEGLAAKFGRTAALAVEAGYDGVELHGAHGYLLTQFLSPVANRRSDVWGGDEERRLAFPKRVLEHVRTALGDRPIIYRLSADEFRPDGLDIGDMERIAPKLVQAGADVLHVSIGWGTGAGFAKIIEPISTPEGWRIPFAARIRRATGAPVIAVGQIRWPETGEAAIASGEADFIALGRPVLADPDWANKALAGQRDVIRPCTSCNWCISHRDGRVQIGCAENPRAGAELDPPTELIDGRGRTALVVGAGPGGIAAALLLDQMGFETALVEARKWIGGGLAASAAPPGKEKLLWYRDYLRRRLAASNVRLILGAEAGPAMIDSVQPDIVIVATGSTARPCDIAGAPDPMFVDAYDLLMGDAGLELSCGERAVVYGGGETGCETAEFLAHQGIQVTLVTRSPVSELARSAERVYRQELVDRLAANPQIEVVEKHRVLQAENGLVVLGGADGTREIVAARLVIAQGRVPSAVLRAHLESAGIPYSVIGDSERPGRIGDAVHAAYRAAQALGAQYAGQRALAC